MSSSIWTRCAGRAELRRLSGRAWRVVEAQHRVATRKLVDSTEEQAILERMLERSKPPLPADGDGRHELLVTPFRYPPLRHGSRFGTRAEPSLWYGSTRLPTALAETAYYRLVFLDGTAADLGLLTVEMSAFRAAWRTARGIDLVRPPFDAERDSIASPVRYEATQRLGREMRDDGVTAFRYPSARRPGGVNVGLFTPAAFTAEPPSVPETWTCIAEPRRVEFVRHGLFERRTVAFPREAFEVDGRLPAPAP